MILIIDASSREEVKLGLLAKNKAFWHKFQVNYDFSQKLPLEIEKFLKKRKISLKTLEKLAISAGPGPFSHIRTAVASANALALALNIPILAVLGLTPDFSGENLQKIKPQKTIVPFYEREPNITINKVKS